MFGKDVEQSCRFCCYGYITFDENVCLCDKLGAIMCRSKCRRFKYDPLKRDPTPKTTIKADFDPKDFSLD